MKYLITIILISVVINAQNRWEKLNGPVGGSISALFTLGDTLIAGTAWDHGLIFYSTDRGAYWERAIVKTSGSFSSFVQTADGGIIAASWPEGLFKSFDLKNWANIYNDGNKFVYLGKDFDNNIFAGTRNNHVAIPDKIFISTNNGSSWQISLDNYFSNISNFLLFEDSTLFAGGWKGILKKENGFNTWSEINLDTVPSGIYTVLSDTSHNIYAFNIGTTVIMSSDSGNSWKYLDTLGFLRGGNSMGTCIFNSRLIGGLEWTGLHYAWGVVVSDDGGYTWRESNTGMPSKVSSVISSAKSGNDTYIGTSAAGVFKSTNYGESWSSLNNGLTAAFTADLHFDNEGIIYSANWSNGFQKSTDNGETWTVINNGLTNVNCYSIISDDDGILIGGTDEAIFRSTDNGLNWGPAGSAGNNFAYRLEKDKLNRIYALTYGTGLYRSTNSGISWVKLDNNFISGYVFGFAIDSSGAIYAGTRQGSIYKSINDGQTWTRVYISSNSGSVVSRISIAPNGFIFAANINEGILRSTNHGETWQILTNGFYSLKIREVNSNSEGDLYASTYSNYQTPYEDKLYKSTDIGESWTDITGEMYMTVIYEIYITENNDMYFATDESIWRNSPDSTTAVLDNNNTVTEYRLNQNYPNPFNPSTKISYTLKEEGNVKLLIYDIKGELISTLVNEKQQSGNYEVDFTLPGNISTGVYIYRLTVTDNSSRQVFADVKKMIYLK